MSGLTTRREFLERSAAIHPALGIGRVGNSPESFWARRQPVAVA